MMRVFACVPVSTIAHFYYMAVWRCGFSGAWGVDCVDLYGGSMSIRVSDLRMAGDYDVNHIIGIRTKMQVFYILDYAVCG